MNDCNYSITYNVGSDLFPEITVFYCGRCGKQEYPKDRLLYSNSTIEFCQCKKGGITVEICDKCKKQKYDPDLPECMSRPGRVKGTIEYCQCPIEKIKHPMGWKCPTCGHIHPHCY